MSVFNTVISSPLALIAFFFLTLTVDWLTAAIVRGSLFAAGAAPIAEGG